MVGLGLQLENTSISSLTSNPAAQTPTGQHAASRRVMKGDDEEMDHMMLQVTTDML